MQKKSSLSYTVILFDLDGTLIDSKEGVFRSLNYAFTKLGIKTQPESVLEKFIGPSLASVFCGEFSFSEEKTEEAVAYYREYYQQEGYLIGTLYQGIGQLLLDLKNQGKKIALATKKPEVFARKILKVFGIDSYFDVIKGSDLTDKSAHKAHILKNAMEAVKEEKEMCIMVGDMKYDILAAKDTGMDSAGVLYGYGDRESLEKEGASYLVEDVEELSELLMGEGRLLS